MSLSNLSPSAFVCVCIWFQVCQCCWSHLCNDLHTRDTNFKPTIPSYAEKVNGLIQCYQDNLFCLLVYPHTVATDSTPLIPQLQNRGNTYTYIRSGCIQSKYFKLCARNLNVNVSFDKCCFSFNNCNSQSKSECDYAPINMLSNLCKTIYQYCNPRRNKSTDCCQELQWIIFLIRLRVILQDGVSSPPHKDRKCLALPWPTVKRILKQLDQSDNGGFCDLICTCTQQCTYIFIHNLFQKKIMDIDKKQISIHYLNKQEMHILLIQGLQLCLSGGVCVERVLKVH